MLSCNLIGFDYFIFLRNCSRIMALDLGYSTSFLLIKNHKTYCSSIHLFHYANYTILTLPVSSAKLY